MQPLIILSGPTAVGKTRLSLALAKEAGCEIISADSMQVYRGLDIGTDKLPPEQRQGIPHHLIDVLDPGEDYNVMRFREMASECIREIAGRGHLPLLAGGTGFYIQAVLYDVDFTPHSQDDEQRRLLQKEAQEQGCEALHRRLEALDPEAAASIHPNNIQRTIRALEYAQQTGGTISEHNRQMRQKSSPYRYAYFVLTDERERLYERINRRVDEMMEQGLMDEVIRLRKRGIGSAHTSMQAIGYRQICAYLDGACDMDEAVRLIKRDTRHYAKRQLTWLRRERDVIWLDRSILGGDEQILEYMMQILRGRGLIS